MEFSQSPEGSEVNLRIVELQDLWRTEANAPEILTYNEALVSDILQIIKDQQVYLC